MNDPLSNPSKYLGNELKYIEQVLNSEAWSSTAGSWTNVLEAEFARKIGRKYAVAFNSGTSTLHAALEVVGVGPGDEVISPAITVMMNTTSTFHANAVPVYADVDPHTFNIDVDDVERKITSKTKAVVAVALYGLPPDLPRLKQLCTSRGIALIEDNAQCVLSEVDGKRAGTFGDFASYSFENTKHLSCGEGGMLITDNEQYAVAARKFGGHGFKNLAATEGRIRLNHDQFQNPNYERHDSLGWNYRLPEFNSAIAMAQLERIEELIQLRVDSANIFIEAMQDADYLVPQSLPQDYTNSYYTLGVVYNGAEKIGVPWTDFRKNYVERGGDGIYSAWMVPYLEPLVASRQFVSRYPEVYADVSYSRGLCPVAEDLQQKLMQFKTNYRDLDIASKKADILRETIRHFA